LKESGEDATALLRSSAESGVWRSSATLGVLAAQGKLLPQDNQMAYQWLLVAQMQGGQEATHVVQDLLEATTRTMPDDQRYSVEAAAKDWVRLHPGTKVYDHLTNSDKTLYPMEGVYSGQNPANNEQHASNNLK